MSQSTEAEALAAEKLWRDTIYRPDEPQLTVRAVLFGMVVGMLLCLSNLYIVLKTGWSVGVTLTACILGWSFFSLVNRLPWFSRYGMLENNAMSSVASGAGYMTGGGNMAALPALLMLTAVRPDAWVLMLWFAGVAALGVFAAIPIKRQLVNREKLPFPTGTATAETIRLLHSHEGEGKKQAQWLLIAGLVGAAFSFLRDVKASWKAWSTPEVLSLPVDFHGKPLASWTLGVEGGVLMLGGGALMSFRTGWSLLVGGLLTFGVIAPAMAGAGIITTISFKGIVGWTVWMGAAVLVSSGLTSFAFQWKSVAKAMKELKGVVTRKRATDEEDPLAGVECAPAWFPLGFLIIGPPVALLAWYAFDIPLWAGLLALPLALVSGVIAARVTGETDVTPTKALGPVTQLVYAGLLPGQLVPNIMSANIAGGVGLHSADLLTNLKCGYLLGASPRQQFYGQLFGVLAGAAIVVPAFNLIVPDASALGGTEFPAPAAQVWANVSKMLVDGLSALHPSARWAALIGLVVGTALSVLEVKLPKDKRRYVPSASGLGIGMVIPAFNSIMMFAGAAWAEWMRRKRGEKEADKVTMPVASGFIAGESLLGVAVKMLVAFGYLQK
ncbi:MAG: OPT/YSL family transporter [Myxococcales bacterium]|nr:OPT/YSL family transporter [Myxococcales bacterium]